MPHIKTKTLRRLIQATSAVYVTVQLYCRNVCVLRAFLFSTLFSKTNTCNIKIIFPLLSANASVSNKRARAGVIQQIARKCLTSQGSSANISSRKMALKRCILAEMTASLRPALRSMFPTLIIIFCCGAGPLTAASTVPQIR